MRLIPRKKTASPERVAIIGGGWAGCAAAVELARRGHEVHLFESARVLGGRARCVEINDRILDNGQHILLGAYVETLRMMRLVGIDDKQALLRLPLQMRYPAGAGGMDFVAPKLPAPLHLLVALVRAKGLAWEDKLALARFSTTARWMDWRLNVDCTVLELLDRFDQTPRLTQLMWRPLCIAALNTPPERASAQVFLNVLRDSLGAKRAASDMLIPKLDLTSLFPQHAASDIAKHGGTVHCGITVNALHRHQAGWRIETSAPPNAVINAAINADFDSVIVATQASHAAKLIEHVSDSTSLTALTSFSYEPITTCYLQYSSDVRLPAPFFALLDDAEKREWGQFVFDRGQLDSRQAGLIAVVVSASTEAIATGHRELTVAIAAQIAKVLGAPALNNFIWSKIISEKRATFACAPGLKRPPNDIGIHRLFIAGDYTASDYPATIESAVRSGVGAAQLIDR